MAVRSVREGHAPSGGMSPHDVRLAAIFAPGVTVREAAEACALDALRVLYDALDSDDVKVQAAAARDLAYIWGRLPPLPAPPDATPEARAVALEASLRQPDDELAKALAAAGWARQVAA